MTAMNKKAFLYAFLLGVIGTVILFVRLYSLSETQAMEAQILVGKSSFEELAGYHDTELALQYFDVASTHAVNDAVADLLLRGGWFVEPACGHFGALTLWYDRGVSCIPSQQNLSEQLTRFIERDYYTNQLSKNPYVKYAARDFVYYADVLPGRTALEGYATKPFLVTIRCTTQKKELYPGFLATVFIQKPMSWLGWHPTAVEQTTYACGQVAVRPDFRHEIPVSVNDLTAIGGLLQPGMACDNDPDPAGCLREFGAARQWKTDVVEDKDSAGATVGTVAIFSVPLQGRLPGIDEPLAVHFGVRVRKGAVKQ